MPSKPRTIDAAERRQIRAELKQLAAAERKIQADWKSEEKRLRAEVEKADRAFCKFHRRKKTQMPLALAKIHRRREILQGRL